MVFIFIFHTRMGIWGIKCLDVKRFTASQVHSGERKIVFGISTVDLGYVQPIFLAEDNSLGGYRFLAVQSVDLEISRSSSTV